VFSTAEDNQPAVTIKVAQGERELFRYNKSLGEFNLEGIDPAPRGQPQIEVTLDIDANGIMHVGAKDKKTGKENKITIKANSGLTEEEIQRMVKDAELNAESDRQAKEAIDARNQADNLVHSMRKELDEKGQDLSDDEKASINEALTELESAAKDSDVEKIKTATEKVYSACAPLLNKESAKTDDDIVDAEFTDKSK